MSSTGDTPSQPKKQVYEKPKLIRHDELQQTINPYGPRPPQDNSQQKK